MKTKNKDRYDNSFSPKPQEGKLKQPQARLVGVPKVLSHVFQYKEQRRK